VESLETVAVTIAFESNRIGEVGAGDTHLRTGSQTCHPIHSPTSGPWV